MMESYTCIAWGCLTIAAVTVTVMPPRFLGGVTQHGKLVDSESNSGLVPKKWFVHFYAFSVLINLVWIYELSSARFLLLIHCSRRFIEQSILFPYQSESRMHVLAYVLGYVFYLLVAVSVPRQPCSPFVWLIGNLLQFLAHRDLFENRRTGDAHCKHKPPRTILFRYMTCPHYFAEMLIYAGMMSVQEWPSLLCVVFLVVSLSVNWRNQSRWYSKFTRTS